ncbi:hypothetical protein DFH11DRAFT_1582571 [Phellopilus nigrolimitatus]|nr:hypothetical protein DFH11DRAFT_1582571 [Phellopilus nigrolimitatus]
MTHGNRRLARGLRSRLKRQLWVESYIHNSFVGLRVLFLNDTMSSHNNTIVQQCAGPLHGLAREPTLIIRKPLSKEETTTREEARRLYLEKRKPRAEKLEVIVEESEGEIDQQPELSTMPYTVETEEVFRRKAHQEYERRWYALVCAEVQPEGQFAACLRFEDVPWPTFCILGNAEFSRAFTDSPMPLSRTHFPLDRSKVECFLFGLERAVERGCEIKTLREEEAFLWDPEIVESRLVSKVVSEDRQSVRLAHAIISAYVRGANDEDVDFLKKELAYEGKLQHSAPRRPDNTIFGFDAFIQSQKANPQAIDANTEPKIESSRQVEPYAPPVVAASDSFFYKPRNPTDRTSSGDSLFGSFR